MFIGRYWVIVPVLAIAGSLAAKNTVPTSAGTMPTHTPLFIAMLVGVIILIGVLTFVPALALGPIAEHMHLLHAGRRAMSATKAKIRSSQHGGCHRRRIPQARAEKPAAQPGDVRGVCRRDRYHWTLWL